MSKADQANNRSPLRTIWFYVVAVVVVLAPTFGLIWSAVTSSKGSEYLQRFPLLLRWYLALPVGVAVFLAVVIAVALMLSFYFIWPLFAHEVNHLVRRQKLGKPAVESVTSVGEKVDDVESKLDAQGVIIREIAKRPLPVDIPFPPIFVGRGQQLKMVLELLGRGQNVMITGTNATQGIGKSALAAKAFAAALNANSDFPGGAFWIPCSDVGINGLGDLWRRVVDHVPGLSKLLETSEEHLASRLHDALGGMPQKTLLVLDNVDPSVDVVKILDTLFVPHHSIVLISCRRVLEHDPRSVVVELGPLSQSDSETLVCEKLKRETERSEEKRPTASDKAAIPEFAQRLGGVPLRIYYAVGLAVSSNSPLLQVGAASLLTDTVRDTPSIDTLSLDHIWESLNLQRQRLFAGLSLLQQEGFSLEEVEALARAAMPEDEPQAEDYQAAAMDDLVVLTTYQIVQELGDIAGKGDRYKARYYLHHVTRAYAKQRLANMPALHERLVNALVTHWMKSLQSAPSGIMDKARAFAYKWVVWGKRIEVATLLSWALQTKDKPLPTDVEWANLQLASISWNRRDFEGASRKYHEVIARAQQLGASSLEVNARRGLAEMTFERAIDQFDEAPDSYTKALAEARETFVATLAEARTLGDVECAILSLHDVGTVEFFSGVRSDHALRAFQQAYDLAYKVNYRDSQARELRWMARVRKQKGEREVARDLIRQSLSLSVARYNPYNSGKCYELLAELDIDQDPAQALDEYRRGVELLEKAQAPVTEIAAMKAWIATLESNPD